jgi:hypothetical protein
MDPNKAPLVVPTKGVSSMADRGVEAGGGPVCDREGGKAAGEVQFEFKMLGSVTWSCSSRP